jgi:peptidoglycan/LPS O-acetylase OafA/YrhL
MDRLAAAVEAPANEISYSPALDGLRAICIVLTLFNHITGAPAFINGSAGVDIFFPLSGFLITGIMLKKDWSDLKSYLIRRFFRIAPVYYLSLTFTAIFALCTRWMPASDSRLDQLGNIIIPSLLMSRELANAPTLFGQAWTVGIEEKFYIAWPIMILLMRGVVGRVTCLIAALVFSLAFGNPFLLRGYGGIALGCLAGILYFSFGFRIKTSYAAWILAAAYCYCISSEGGYKNITIDFAAALFIPSIFSTQSVISRALSYAPIVFVGRLTFSVYMLHVLILYFTKWLLRYFGLEYWPLVFVLGYAFTLICAFFVYQWFEAPLIEYGKRLAGKSRQKRSIGREVRRESIDDAVIKTERVRESGA